MELARKIKNDIIKSVTLAKIACILNDDKILDEALKIAKKMDLLHYSEALSKIAVEMAKVGRFDGALNIANEVIEERFRLDALETITFYLGDVGELDKALEIAEKLKYRSQRALSNLSIKLAMAGDFEKSIEVAEMIKEKSWKAETLVKIGYVFYKADKPHGKLFEEALSIAESINDNATRSRIFLRIAVELAKAKMDYKEVLDEGLRIEKNDVDILNTSLGLAEIGEVDEGLKVVELIKGKCWKVEALAKIARISDHNLFENAINLARSIGDKSLSVEALSRVAVEMAKSGESYNDIMAEIVEKLNDLDTFEKSKVLTNIVVDVIDIGDVEEAIELSDNILDEIYQSEALFYIVAKLAKIKEFDRALEIANRIFEDYWKSKALSEIVVGLIGLKV